MSSIRRVPRPPAPPPSGGRPPRPAPGRTRLVADPSQVPAYTANRETDARTALTRGLAEYLRDLQLEVPGGRLVRFRRVLDNWSDPEAPAEYPSAVVLSSGDAAYDSSRFTPMPSPTERLPPPDGRFLLQLAELQATLTLEIWATDAAERMALVAAVEDAMVPVAWMYGARLELPHYFGVRAEYSLQSVAYVDGDLEAMQRYRKAVLTISAIVPLIRLVKLPMADIRVVVQEVDVDVVVETEAD